MHNAHGLNYADRVRARMDGLSDTCAKLYLAHIVLRTLHPKTKLHREGLDNGVARGGPNSAWQGLVRNLQIE